MRKIEEIEEQIQKPSQEEFAELRRDRSATPGLTRFPSPVITPGMKVAVSIPDEVFAETEHLAKQLKASRSEIYSRALSEFLHRHAPDRVTELMDQVVDNVGEETDSFTRRAARRVLRRVEW